MVDEWTKLDSELLRDFRIFRARRDTRRSPRTGEAHSFYVLEAADWVNIIPVTPQGSVVFVHQFRHGTERVTLEVPGGMVDAADDSPAASAQREMREETGYEAAEIVYLGSVEPNPAFLDNRCHSYLALNARQVAPPSFDGAEDIAVEEIPLADVPQLISNGRITHALVVAAFYHLDRYTHAHPDWQTKLGLQ